MKILNRYTGATLWESPCSTMRETVVKAVSEHSDLRGANLCGANLCGADLCGANLCGANLCDANLCDANLCDADLCGADLCGANLCGAYLCDANLCDANLCDANLRGADLCGADLCGANLCGANLCDAKNFSELSQAQLSIVPEHGEFTGWKICRADVLVKVLIPADARRSSASGRKCRAEMVKVLEVIGANEGISGYDSNVKYRVGETVKCDAWNEDRWTECGGGIHFFITRVEAESYQL